MGNGSQSTVHRIAFLMGSVVLVTSCNTDSSPDQAWYPEVAVNQACEGIFKGSPEKEMKEKLSDGRIYEHDSSERFSITGEESVKGAEGSSNSTLATICKVYEGVGEENSSIRIDFRRMDRPTLPRPPVGEDKKKYLMGSDIVLEERGEVMKLGAPCILPALADESGDEHSIRLTMVDDLGLETRTRAIILASAAEKLAVGMGCANEVEHMEDTRLKEIKGA